MLSTAIIVFREVFEIALIVSIVLAATRGLPRRTRWVAIGMLGGCFGAAIIALFAQAISDAAEGMGQEIFNGAILYTAAAVIGWTVVWMKRHARAMTAHLKKVGSSVADGEMPLYSLALVVGIAVLREGAEIVLLAYGQLASGMSALSFFSGSMVGATGGVFVGVLFYYGIIKAATKHLFQITGALLVLLCAGMAAQGTAFLIAADVLPPLANPLWDSSFILSSDSLAGRVMHALVGYSDRPTGMQVVAFAVVIAVLAALLKFYGTHSAKPIKA